MFIVRALVCNSSWISLLLSNASKDMSIIASSLFGLISTAFFSNFNALGMRRVSYLLQKESAIEEYALELVGSASIALYSKSSASQ